MSLVAKISAKSGKALRSVALRKGVNTFPVDADAVVVIVDEATGKIVENAQVERHGGEISVTVSDAAVAYVDGGATGATPPVMEDIRSASAGEFAAAPEMALAGGGSVAAVVGGLALAGAIAAAASGGKGTPPAPKDTTPPAAPTGLALAAGDDTGSSSSDRVTSQTSALTITGTAEAGATVTIKEGAAVLATGTADASGNFSIDVSLAAGAHTLTASAADKAGNASGDSAGLAITVDTTAPGAPTALALAAADDTGASSTDGVTSQTRALTISGTAEAGSTVTLRDGGTVIGTEVAGTGGTFTLDVALTAGTHSLTATATDAAGNVGAASAAKTVTVDTTAPAAVSALTLDPSDDSGISTTDGITNHTTGLSVSGSAEAGATITLYDSNAVIGTTTASPTGAFSFELAFSGGAHPLTVTATDAAGNVSARSPAKTIQIDTAPPAAPAAPQLDSADDTGSLNNDLVTNQTSNLTLY
jgi:hypothetical protein